MIKVTQCKSYGTDLDVANAARVSFAKHKEIYDERDTRLIRYLAREGHYAPFGHCFVSVRVTAPIFVARQLVKHKFLRFSEESRRYISDTPDFFRHELRSATSDKKQGSGDMLRDPRRGNTILDRAHARALQDYNELLDIGVCEEQARTVLPLNMITNWYWSGSLDAFANMCNLRCKSDAQAETRMVADIIDGYLIHAFPDSWEALRGD